MKRWSPEDLKAALRAPRCRDPGRAHARTRSTSRTSSTTSARSGWPTSSTRCWPVAPPTTTTSRPTTKCCATPSSRLCWPTSARCRRSATGPNCRERHRSGSARRARSRRCTTIRSCCSTPRSSVASAGDSFRRWTGRACTTISTFTARSISTRPTCTVTPTFKDVKVLEVVVEPGETMFLPLGWWHQVRSLDVSLSFSYSNLCRAEPLHVQESDDS